METLSSSTSIHVSGLAVRNEHRTAKNLLERTNDGLSKLSFPEKILEITWQ